MYKFHIRGSNKVILYNLVLMFYECVCVCVCVSNFLLVLRETDQTMALFKEVLYSFFVLFFVRLFHIYIHCREFNPEFNKLIKTICHPPPFWGENDIEHTHLCQEF